MHMNSQGQGRTMAISTSPSPPCVAETKIDPKILLKLFMA